MDNNNIIEDVKLLITKISYASSAGNFFIYQIAPLNDNAQLIKKHPIYHTRSIIATKEWAVGTELHLDIAEEYNSRRQEIEYKIHRIIYDYPKDANGQWDFLQRFCNNNSYKNIFAVINKNITNKNILILDKLTDYDPDFQKAIALKLRKHDQERFPDFVNNLLQYKSAAAFIDNLPSDVADLLTDNKADKLANLVPGDAKRSATVFLENPYLAMKIDGFGFKTVDQIRQQLANLYPDNQDYAADSPERLYYGAYEVINNRTLKNGDTYLTLPEFKIAMTEDLGINAETVDFFISSGQYQQTKNREYFAIAINNNLVSTVAMYQAEKMIYDYCTGLQHEQPAKPIADYDQKLNAFLIKEDATLTDEQEKLMHMVNQHQINLLVGPGGVGKTWLVGKLIKFVQTKLKWNVLLTAPTGKASQVLAKFTHYNAQTIHSAFNLYDDHSSPQLDHYYDLLVIDEFSMVDSQLMAKVVKAISKYPTMRVLMVGDEFQLPSVGAGNLLHDFIEYHLVSVCRLSKVFRAEDETGGITKLSQELRHGFTSLTNNNNKMYAVGNDLAVQNITDPDNLHRRVLQIYQHLLDENYDPSDIMVLAPKNKGLTEQLQYNLDLQALIRKKEHADPNDICFSRNIYGYPTNFYQNDLIMINRNREYPVSDNPNQLVLSDGSQTGLHNGDIGRIVDIGMYAMIVKITGHKKKVYIAQNDLGDVTLAYAFTIHKSQGSQAPAGIISISTGDYYMLNANLLYTGVSRFEQKLYLVGDLKQVRARSRKFINRTRKTLLSWFCQNINLVF